MGLDHTQKAFELHSGPIYRQKQEGIFLFHWSPRTGNIKFSIIAQLVQLFSVCVRRCFGLRREGGACQRNATQIKWPFDILLGTFSIRVSWNRWIGHIFCACKDLERERGLFTDWVTVYNYKSPFLFEMIDVRIKTLLHLGMRQFFFMYLGIWLFIEAQHFAQWTASSFI